MPEPPFVSGGCNSEQRHLFSALRFVWLDTRPRMSSAEGENPFGSLLGAPNSDNRRRSQRVLLQIAVLVGVDLPGGKRGQTQAFTLSVNAHGGLLESALRLNTGQEITLINPRTKKEVGGRVVRVEGSSESSFTIAFEFALPNPQFWPIDIPTDWGLKQESG